MRSSKPKPIWSEVSEAIQDSYKESKITLTLLNSVINKLDEMAESKGVTRDEFVERLIAQESRKI